MTDERRDDHACWPISPHGAAFVRSSAPLLTAGGWIVKGLSGNSHLPAWRFYLLATRLQRAPIISRKPSSSLRPGIGQHCYHLALPLHAGPDADLHANIFARIARLGEHDRLRS